MANYMQKRAIKFCVERLMRMTGSENQGGLPENTLHVHRWLPPFDCRALFLIGVNDS